MRPPSSSSDGAGRAGSSPPPAPARGLFDDVLARGAVWEATTDLAWLQAMLDAEAALAWAQVDVGLGSAEDAAAVEAVCRAERFDLAALGREAAAGGNPTIPLVRALREQLGTPAAGLVHRGATSQDIVDTAAVLVAARALSVVQCDLETASSRAADLARAHQATPIAGRTLLQQAMPTTFGLKAAGWMTGLDAGVERLRDVRERRLAAQLGGASGTLDGFGPAAVAVLERFSGRLGLLAPVVPWHAERSRVAELAGALAGAAGAVGKAAQDIVLLAQTEVGEVAEIGAPGAGASSAMPHKHNPIAAVSARAASLQAPGLAAILLGTMHHEHERAAGAWHAEWRPLTGLLRVTGSGASWLAESLARLRIDPDRMRRNLDLLAPELGATAIDHAHGAAIELVVRALADHDHRRR